MSSKSLKVRAASGKHFCKKCSKIIDKVSNSGLQIGHDIIWYHVECFVYKLMYGYNVFCFASDIDGFCNLDSNEQMKMKQIFYTGILCIDDEILINCKGETLANILKLYSLPTFFDFTKNKNKNKQEIKWKQLAIKHINNCKVVLVHHLLVGIFENENAKETSIFNSKINKIFIPNDIFYLISCFTYSALEMDFKKQSVTLKETIRTSLLPKYHPNTNDEQNDQDNDDDDNDVDDDSSNDNVSDCYSFKYL